MTTAPTVPTYDDGRSKVSGSSRHSVRQRAANFAESDLTTLGIGCSDLPSSSVSTVESR